MKSQKAGGNTAEQAGQAIAGLGSGLLNQSFLQGFTGFTNAVSNPSQFLSSEINSLASSVVPSLSNDIAVGTDTLQRQANNAIDAIKARIPGLREMLNPKIDAFGNQLNPAGGSGLNTAINVLKPSSSIDSPLLSELNRLNDTGNPTFPTPDKTIKVGTETVKLTPDQQLQYNTDIGQAVQKAWASTIDTAQYKSLQDAQKSQYLGTAMTDITAVTKKKMLQSIGRQDLAGKIKLTGQQQILSASISDPSVSYSTKVPTASKSSAIGTTPAQKYQEAVVRYNTAKAAGTLSPAKDYATQQSLSKQAVTSQYPQAVLDFYNMSKAQQNSYFASDRGTATKLYDQAKQLDGELVAKGIATTKYKVPITGSTAKKTSTKTTITKIPKLPSLKVKKAPSSKSLTVKAYKAPKIKKFNIAKMPTQPKVKGLA